MSPFTPNMWRFVRQESCIMSHVKNYKTSYLVILKCAFNERWGNMFVLHSHFLTCVTLEVSMQYKLSVLINYFIYNS